MLFEVVAGTVVFLLLFFILVWVLGAPPKPGPTQKPNAGEFWTLWVMRLLRLIGYPKPVTPEEVFAEVDRQAAGCDWKTPTEKADLETPVRLISEITHNPRVHPFGRFMLRNLLITRLVNRRQLWQTLRDHPEIGAIPVKRPIFILGFPRAGSSFMFNLFSKDPGNRYLTLWEQLDSTYGDPTDEKRSEENLEKAKKLQSKLKLLYAKIVEELSHKHLLDVEKNEECQLILQKSLLFPQLSDQEEYMNWFQNHDSELDYLLHRANVQLIEHNRPLAGKKRWVFKAPHHANFLHSLLKAYPDACIVLTQRHPKSIAGSIASLKSTFQQIVWDPIDISGTNRNTPLNYLPKSFSLMQKAMKADNNPNRYFHCQYEDLIKDPIATIQSIYKHFDMEFTEEYNDILHKFVNNDQKRQTKRVKHAYTLETYGMTEEDVWEAYSEYMEVGGYSK